MIERLSGDGPLLSVLEAGTLRLTLHRPAARNAMTDEMLLALRDELRFAEESGTVRCLVLQGAGSAFCAGGDVKAMSAADVSLSGDERVHWQRSIQRDTVGRLYRLPKPTLAVINGPAAGAGLGLALACDMRMMAESAFLLTAFASVGLSGDFGVAWFLDQMLGGARARELMFLSDRIPAEKAVSLGLANWCCAEQDLAASAFAISQRLADAPIAALGYMKENLNRAVHAGLEDWMDTEVSYHIHCGSTADHREGVAAFMERRAARFGGGR